MCFRRACSPGKSSGRRLRVGRALELVKPRVNLPTPRYQETINDMIPAVELRSDGSAEEHNIHELDGAAEHYLRRAVNEARQVFRKLIEQAVAQGEIKDPGDVKTVSSSFVTLVIGLNTISKVVRSERELWRICEIFLSRYGFGMR